jgi:hypothetical protein
MPPHRMPLGLCASTPSGWWDPKKPIRNISKAAAQISKAASFESVALAPNKVEISVRPNDGVDEQGFQCENRKGFFEAITLAFTNKLPRLEHPECHFRGDAHCRYIITWDKTFSNIWERIKRYLVILFLLSGIFPGLGLPPAAHQHRLPMDCDLFSSAFACWRKHAEERVEKQFDQSLGFYGETGRSNLRQLQ